jgi:hypothetical protein
LPERRDRIFLINALAIFLVTLLGAAGESLGMDRQLKSNTVKRRTHSLFYQGSFYFSALVTMPKERRDALMKKFNELLLEQKFFKEILGFV